jgi:hypothetical protein
MISCNDSWALRIHPASDKNETDFAVTTRLRVNVVVGHEWPRIALRFIQAAHPVWEAANCPMPGDFFPELFGPEFAAHCGPLNFPFPP